MMNVKLKTKHLLNSNWQNFIHEVVFNVDGLPVWQSFADFENEEDLTKSAEALILVELAITTTAKQMEELRKKHSHATKN
jgi:hypothetical protein